ncbi:MAG TPA: nucleotide exchange factor GrpE [Desulfobulbus sp.]|nr:nucleotide exchange factor GrpE [Desulfobulbus sp.]
MVDNTKKNDIARDREDAGIKEDPGNVEGVGAAEQEESLEQDYDALQQELEETRDRLLRVAADAENFKKRIEREKEKMLKYAGEDILRELLTTVDNLDRALEQGRAESKDPAQQLQALLEGVELTRNGLLATLQKFGVEPLDAVGKPFNPDEQDALSMEASDEVPANHVLREFAKGYRFKDRMLRHGKVVVSSGSGS